MTGALASIRSDVCASGWLNASHATPRGTASSGTAESAALARAEGEVGLRTFFERYPDARLAGAGSRRDTRVLRGWSSLPVRLGTAHDPVMSSPA